jgi:FkbM family methyltransferase
MQRRFTATDRFWQNVLFRVRPALAASWLKQALRLRRRDIETQFGLFYIDPFSQFGVALASDRGYEPEMRAALEHFLGPRGTFVDVGANEGFFAVMGSRLVGAAGKVIAVEPQSRLKDVVERNLRLNEAVNATLVSCAISDRDGSVELFVSPDMNTGSTSMHNSTRYRLPVESVPMTTLARLFETHGIQDADLVKMDIEGSEYEAVLGSPELFRSGRIRAFTFELHDSAIAARGRDPGAVTRFLSDCGYRVAPGLPAQVWVAPGRQGE